MGFCSIKRQINLTFGLTGRMFIARPPFIPFFKENLSILHPVACRDNST